jgi:hypothetical protein
MTDNTRRALGAFLLIGVSSAAIVTVLRQYSTAYMMIEPSREYSLIAAFMVVGAVVLLVMMPPSAAVKFAFWSVGAAIVAAFAVAAAPKLGLVEHAPLTWRYVLLGAAVSPIAAVLMLFWSLTPKAKVSESDRKLAKVDRKPLRISRKPKAIGDRKRPKELANPDTESGEASAAEMATLLETLTVFVDKGGNRAEAARVLGLTPPGVSDRLRRLYLVEPDLVEEKAPEWVERNIKV